jgi:NADPH-dependent 2,4-dienoyl-CoA reductase/sulfur reductase-like enzyme
MLTDEPYPPYSPPAMVTYFETGEPVHFWRGQDFAGRMGVDYRPGVRAAGITPEGHAIDLGNGEALDYDKLVIASGGRLYAQKARTSLESTTSSPCRPPRSCWDRCRGVRPGQRSSLVSTLSASKSACFWPTWAWRLLSWFVRG